MVARLLCGILAIVLGLLGIVFTTLGLAGVEPRQGSSDDWFTVGLPLAAAGLACVTAFVVLARREAAARRRRRAGARASAEIVRADHKAGIQIGSLLTYDLTVRFAAGGEVTKRLTVVPGTPLVPGETVDVLYDPAGPANFELADPARPIQKGTR
jgi:hypothetical protein